MSLIENPIQQDLIGRIFKNHSEEVLVSLTEYNGHHLISLRVWFERDGQQLPGKSGLSMRVSAIPDLLDLLTKAEAKALELGLISRGSAQ